MNKKIRSTQNQTAKRGILCAFLLGTALLGAFAGCKKAEPAPDGTQGNGSNAAEGTKTPSKDKTLGKDKITSQDVSRGGARYMLTDKGWYNLNTGQGLRYYDFASGKSLMLCNKPECRHDGNAFCVATNAKYTYERACLYDGRLFLSAFEENDTQYLFKLLTVALDGSELNEVLTYFSLEKTEGLAQMTFAYKQDLFIHRNKAFIPICVASQKGDDDFYGTFYGTAVVDLETKEVKYLDETPVDKDNAEVTELRGCGDVVYYLRKEKRNKTTLCRYDLKTGEVTTGNMKMGFAGVFEAVDEDTVAYVAARKEQVYYYHFSTEESELKQTVNTVWIYIQKKADFEGPTAIDVSSLDFRGETPDGKYFIFAEPQKLEIDNIRTDGTYFYIIERCVTHGCVDREGNEYKYPIQLIHVFDKEFQEVITTDIYPAVHAIEEEEPSLYPEKGDNFGFLGEEIYIPIIVARGEGESAILSTQYYRMRRSDLLAGTPVLEKVYER